ncbi:MAG: hypothetical protein JHD27_02925 [Chloroflexi bacterium]|nr:hypothetical protein [Chloroflexota bacterium]
MFFLTKLAVARRSVTILIALAVFGGGVASWGSLKQELLPNIDFSATGQANGVDGDQLVLGPPVVLGDDEIARIARGTAAAIRAVRDEA